MNATISSQIIANLERMRADNRAEIDSWLESVTESVRFNAHYAVRLHLKQRIRDLHATAAQIESDLAHEHGYDGQTGYCGS